MPQIRGRVLHGEVCYIFSCLSYRAYTLIRYQQVVQTRDKTSVTSPHYNIYFNFFFFLNVQAAILKKLNFEHYNMRKCRRWVSSLKSSTVPALFLMSVRHIFSFLISLMLAADGHAWVKGNCSSLFPSLCFTTTGKKTKLSAQNVHIKTIRHFNHCDSMNLTILSISKLLIYNNICCAGLNYFKFVPSCWNWRQLPLLW